MGRRSDKLKTMGALLKVGDYDGVRRHFRRWLFSDSVSYGLRRDLSVPFDAPQAKIPIAVRPMEQGDVHTLLDIRAPGLSGGGIYERLNRLVFMEAKIPTCYVAVTSEGTPCYMQFLIGPEQNAKVQSYFGGLFPWLAPDEVLLEHAFTPESFQGLGIMPSAMAQIAERGIEPGARWAITFVLRDNIPALKGCKRAGFSPYLVRRERWRFFRKQQTFEELPTGTPYPFEREQLVAA